MWKIVLKSVLHQIFCPYLLLAATAFVTFSVVGIFHSSSKMASFLLTGMPYFPIQLGVGAITGFLVGRYSTWPLARWIWIVPLGILLASMASVPPPQGVSVLGYWFGWAGAPGHVPWPSLQPGITMPFYLSGTYSFFSLLGKSGFKRRNTKPVHMAES